VPELGSLGSVRGAFSNERPYREHAQRLAAARCTNAHFFSEV
jgi:hypothetical protein